MVMIAQVEKHDQRYGDGNPKDKTAETLETVGHGGTLSLARHSLNPGKFKLQRCPRSGTGTDDLGLWSGILAALYRTPVALSPVAGRSVETLRTAAFHNRAFGNIPFGAGTHFYQRGFLLAQTHRGQ
jgi:hypothetical protein